MILVDTNVLVYAHVSSFPQHAAARAWLDAALNRGTPVHLPWPSLLGFLRLVINPRIFERPATIDHARKQVASWLACPTVRIPLPTERHFSVLEPLLDVIGNRANLVPDAHLAAIAIEHGLTLCSTDADFARFPGLRWENPISRNSEK